jgi:hypothetical protein
MEAVTACMRLVKGITPLTENFPERNIVHMNISGHLRSVCLHAISTKSVGSHANGSRFVKYTKFAYNFFMQE